MIELGEPLHSSDTAFVRASRDDLLRALCDPFAHAVFWPGLRTTDQRLSGEGEAAVGDAWRVRAVVGWAGVDAEVVVTDMRRKDRSDNVWMDMRGHVDPVVGLDRRRRDLEAETEWYLREWREGTLVTMFWRVRAEPRRRQEALLLLLRRLGWRALHGLKAEFEVEARTR
ncbi:MAG: hypothetical protein IT198_02330 [Acidimicrobiia bacterium]|nr:hypothetical protein [Acidimicrobiia bacterium]